MLGDPRNACRAVTDGPHQAREEHNRMPAATVGEVGQRAGVEEGEVHRSRYHRDGRDTRNGGSALPAGTSASASAPPHCGDGGDGRHGRGIEGLDEQEVIYLDA
eukprot:scaffold19053_cov56-Phaeocystis_antarctica.AAC.1